jgi:hypothetical protein
MRYYLILLGLIVGCASTPAPQPEDPVLDIPAPVILDQKQPQAAPKHGNGKLPVKKKAKKAKLKKA